MIPRMQKHSKDKERLFAKKKESWCACDKGGVSKELSKQVEAQKGTRGGVINNFQ